MKRSCLFAVMAVIFFGGCQRETPTAEEPSPIAQKAQEPPVESPSRPMPSSPVLLSAEQRAVDYSPAKLCNLEGAGDVAFGAGELALNSGAPVLMRGWVGVESTLAAPAGAAIRFQSMQDATKIWEVNVPVDQLREDVAKARNSAGLKNAGFASAINLAGLPDGQYHLVITYFDKNQHYICDNGRLISLAL